MDWDKVRKVLGALLRQFLATSETAVSSDEEKRLREMDRQRVARVVAAYKAQRAERIWYWNAWPDGLVQMPEQEP